MEPGYVGRFAPTPSGPLHLGSAIAAVGSFLQARSRDGQWLLRIDDIDAPRAVAGGAETIIRQLRALGLHWDGQIEHQHSALEQYSQALETLKTKDLLFECACTRKMAGSGPYNGRCRNGLRAGEQGRSMRVKVGGKPVRFEDSLQGVQHIDVAREIGDFIVRRADGIFGYHLTCVVDDARMGVTEVVRGNDLLDSVAPQIFLQEALGLKRPGYLHLPVVVDARGKKLSKQHGARSIDGAPSQAVLGIALGFLGLPVPNDLVGAANGAVLDWATANWAQREDQCGIGTLTSPAVDAFIAL
ncbi:MAG: tRNA glutamyl-Q(34) synthetase GluQRS [Pseudomonadota bacterium]